MFLTASWAVTPSFRAKALSLAIRQWMLSCPKTCIGTWVTLWTSTPPRWRQPNEPVPAVQRLWLALLLPRLRKKAPQQRSTSLCTSAQERSSRYGLRACCRFARTERACCWSIPPQDTDGDGMPHTWETANGLNLKAHDHNGTQLAMPLLSIPRYTNVEVYLQLSSSSDCLKPTHDRPTGVTSGNVGQHGVEVAGAATQHKQVPQAVPVANAGVGNIEIDASGVEHAPRCQPHEAAGG